MAFKKNLPLCHSCIPREALIRCLSLSHLQWPLASSRSTSSPGCRRAAARGSRAWPASATCQSGRETQRGVTLEAESPVKRIGGWLLWAPCDSEEEGKAIRRRTSLIPINLATLACHLVCLSRHRRTNKAATQRLLNQKRIEIMECFIGRK